MLKVTIERLYKLGAEAKNYSTEHVRKKALAELQAKAGASGYSYNHWLATGIWVLEEDFETLRPETLSKVETLKPETVTQIETVRKVETLRQKQPTQHEKAVIETLKPETLRRKACEQCGAEFEYKRESKRFCNQECKNIYNNSKR